MRVWECTGSNGVDVHLMNGRIDGSVRCSSPRLLNLLWLRWGIVFSWGSGCCICGFSILDEVSRSMYFFACCVDHDEDSWDGEDWEGTNFVHPWPECGISLQRSFP